jgi:serine protease inhibitor
MRTLSVRLALFLPLALPGCGLLEPGDGGSGRLTELPRPLSAAEQEVVRSSNHFAFDLLRRVHAVETSANLFLSPLSASMALGMTMNGAAGETLAEMRSMLGFEGLTQEEINSSYRSLIDLLLALDDAVDMRIANALWVREGFPLHEPFVTTNRDHFDATTASLDFSDPASLRTINDWVSRSTGGRITRILDDLDGDVVLYLMNAFYFKGDWTTQFDPRNTRDAPFRRIDGVEHRVQMMEFRQMETPSYLGPDLQIVDLPYGREAFSMTLVIPGPEGGTLDEIVAGLDAARWDGWMERLREGRLDVHLPRFGLEYERTLNETLKVLGMQLAFEPHRADLTGISPARRDLYIDEVKQKTFLEVNEKGTEAAAVTSIGVVPTSLAPTFRADQPFLIVLRERFSGTILFIGTIGAPDSR